MNTNTRRTEVLIGARWQETNLCDVKAEQAFRMFESNGRAVLDAACQSIFQANSDGFTDEHGVHGINVK